jgi:hypothetical protein
MQVPNRPHSNHGNLYVIHEATLEQLEPPSCLQKVPSRALEPVAGLLQNHVRLLQLRRCPLVLRLRRRRRTINDPLRRHPPLFRQRRHFHHPQPRFCDLFEPVILPEMWSRFEDIQDLLQRYNIELIAVGVRVDIGDGIPISESGRASRLVHGRGVVVEG